MPNFDGGHYFLTAIIPVRLGLTKDPADNSRVLSHVHAIKEVLAGLPTDNSLAGVDNAAVIPSAPFSRDLRTHLARLVVIDDVAYNGRVHKDALLTALQGPNPVITEAVDHLPWPYLAIIIDFDAADGSSDTLAAYLRGLWSVMSDELVAIFSHLQGFDAGGGVDSFVDLVLRSQLETTMSFNDYYWTGQGQGETLLWEGPSGPVNRAPSALRPPLIAFGVLVVVALLSGLRGWLLVLAVLASLGATVFWLYKRVLQVGFSPFPTAARTDLPSVLKALYLQRHFIRFMINQQGQPPSVLKYAFADFLAVHRPDEVSSPTQKPATTIS